MTISGKTRVCGVIGNPIEHSLSPLMHNTAFAHLGLDFVFLAFRVKAAELEDAVRGVRGLGIHGLNVTMPHKSAVLKYLDEVDSTAKFLGAANTILNKNGKLAGCNTDGTGAIKALTENGIGLKRKKVLLLGAGGAARAVAFSLAKEVEELIILNRDADKAIALAETLGKESHKNVIGGIISSSAIKKNLADSDVLINATSVGMSPNTDVTLVESGWLKPDLCVMDIVYNPLETKLAKDAKAAGARVVSGIEMLLYQGAASFEIWTGRHAPVEVMRKAVLDTISGEDIQS